MDKPYSDNAQDRRQQLAAFDTQCWRMAQEVLGLIERRFEEAKTGTQLSSDQLNDPVGALEMTQRLGRVALQGLIAARPPTAQEDEGQGYAPANIGHA